MLHVNTCESRRLCVVSQSPDRLDLVDDHLAFTVTQAKFGQVIPEADLYVWDHSPECDVRSYVLAKPTARHFLLADPKDLGFFGDLQTSVCILLKPLSAFRFRAFAELAWKSWQLERTAEEADSLRSDRNDLLKYVLDVNLKLQEHDQERSNFLARAMHDLRIPLTALHGYCGLLSDGKAGTVTPAQQALLDRMKKSAKRLAQMAGGALDLLLEGRFAKQVQRSPEDFGETLSRALQDIYPLIREKAIQLRVDIQPPCCALSFDSGQIQQVLVNLLENSSKVTPRKGKIEIRAYPAGQANRSSRWYSKASLGSTGFYQVDVSDSGPGVPRELAERIFEQYASYVGGVSRASSGLGLAICQSIINAHSGHIWATPSSEGGRFSFVLPISPVDEFLPEHTGKPSSTHVMSATFQ